MWCLCQLSSHRQASHAAADPRPVPGDLQSSAAVITHTWSSWWRSGVCVCVCVRSPGAGVVCDQTHSSCPCWLAMCSGRRPALQGLLASAWCWSRSLTVSPWPCLQASVKAVFPSHVWRFTPAPGRTKHTSQPLTSEKKCPMTRNDVLFWDLYLLLSWPVLLLVCGYSESIIFIYLFMSR